MAWYYRHDKKSDLPGAQIDLLIDRQDRTINLCEMKFYGTEFKVTKTYAQDLRRKVHVFKEVTGTKKNIFITMITTYGMIDTAYSREIIANSLSIEELFH